MNAELYAATGQTLKFLLACAWLAPLAGFAVEIFGGYWSTRRASRLVPGDRVHFLGVLRQRDGLLHLG